MPPCIRHAFTTSLQQVRWVGRGVDGLVRVGLWWRQATILDLQRSSLVSNQRKPSTSYCSSSASVGSSRSAGAASCLVPPHTHRLPRAHNRSPLNDHWLGCGIPFGALPRRHSSSSSGTSRRYSARCPQYPPQYDYFTYYNLSKTQCENNPWMADRGTMFKRLDSFIQRCEDLLYVCKTAQQFEKMMTVVVVRRHAALGRDPRGDPRGPSLRSSEALTSSHPLMTAGRHFGRRADQRH